MAYGDNNDNSGSSTFLQAGSPISSYSYMDGTGFSGSGNGNGTTPGQQLQNELSMTMKSVRDTLAISFQTLNLTMSSINTTLRNMSSQLSPGSLTGAARTYVPSQQVITQTGPLSGPMSSFLSNSSLLNLYTQPKPYNVDPYEYSYQANNERGYRWANTAVNAGSFAGNFALTGLAAGAIGRMATRGLAKAPIVGPAMGRMLGSGLGRLGMSMAVGFPLAGMVLDPVFGSIQDEAESYGRDISGIQRMSGRFGNEFTTRQSATVARGMRRGAFNELMNSTSYDTKLGESGYRSLLMTGMQASLFHGSNPEDLVKQLEKGASVVRLLTGVLNSKDINDAMNSVVQLKGMGINVLQNQNYAVQMGNNAFKFGSLMGMPSANLSQMAMQAGGNSYSQFGMAGFAGVIPMMKNMALAHEMEKRHFLSAAEVSVGGGHAGIAQNMNTAVAGMLASPQLGDVMLAASMNGGGNFDMSRFTRGMQGGYFGMLNQGAANIAGNPVNFAKFLMNKTNMHAQMAEGGMQQDAIVGMLRSAVSQAPFMQGLKYQDREPMTQAYVKQILGSMGLPADDATVKALSMQVLHPNSMNSMEREANRHLSRGAYYSSQDKMGVFRPFTRIAEGFDRLPEQITQNTTKRLGRWAEDLGLSAFTSDYDMYSPYSGGEATPQALRNFMKMGANPYSYSANSANMYTPGELNSAYAMANGTFGGFGAGDTFNTPFGRMSGGGGLIDLLRGRQNAPFATGNMYNNYKDYYKYMSDDKSVGVSTYAKYGNILGGMSYRDFVGGYGQFRDSKLGSIFKSKDDLAGGGVQYMYEMLAKNNPEFLNKNRDLFLNSRGYQQFAGDYSSISGDILQRAGIGNGGSGISREALMTQIANSDSLDSYAKKYGMSKQQLAYAMSQQMFGDKWSNNVMDMWHLSGGTMDAVNRLGAVAGSSSKTTQDDEAIRLIASGLRFGDKQIGAMRNLGFDDEMLGSMMNSKNLQSDVDVFGNAIGALASGKDASGLSRGIRDPKLLKIFDNLAQKDPDEIRKYLKQLHSGAGSSISYAEVAKMSLGGAVGKKLDATMQDQADYLFGGAGKDIYESLKSGNLDDVYKRISGLNSDDAQVQDIQSTINDIYKTRKGGAESRRGLAEGLGINYDDVKNLSQNDFEQQILATAMKSSQSAKENYDKEKYRDGKDYRDALTQDGKAFRVIIDKSAQSAADEAAKTSEVTRGGKTEILKTGNNNSNNIGRTLPTTGEVSNYGTSASSLTGLVNNFKSWANNNLFK